MGRYFPYIARVEIASRHPSVSNRQSHRGNQVAAEYDNKIP